MGVGTRQAQCQPHRKLRTQGWGSGRKGVGVTCGYIRRRINMKPQSRLLILNRTCAIKLDSVHASNSCPQRLSRGWAPGTGWWIETLPLEAARGSCRLCDSASQDDRGCPGLTFISPGERIQDGEPCPPGPSARSPRGRRAHLRAAHPGAGQPPGTCAVCPAPMVGSCAS